MMTHTHHCLNIKLTCGGCGKEYDFSDAIEKHINEVHGGDIKMDQQFFHIDCIVLTF